MMRVARTVSARAPIVDRIVDAFLALVCAAYVGALVAASIARALR
jgi:hypothetical protein